MRAERVIRDAFHRARTFAPRRPFERPAPEFPGLAAWPPRLPVLDAFSPSRVLAKPREPGPRPRAPLPAGDTLLWTSVSLADFCNLKTTRGHTQRAFDPRTRVELSLRYSPAPTDAGCVGPRCVAAPETCEPRSATHRLAHDAFHWAWTEQTEGRSVRAKASRALLDDVARALLVTPRAPVSPARLAVRSGEPRRASHRPRLPSDAAPRRVAPSKEPGCLLPQ